MRAETTSAPRRAKVPDKPTLGRRIFSAFLGLVGDLFVTVGVLLLLFTGWQLFWTDVVADADASQVVSSLESEFTTPVANPPMPALGEAYGIVYVPRFAEDYAKPLFEGTGRETLKRGIGHYEATAQPGEIGNFSMAAHRTTYGKPFNQIAELQPGDAIMVRTATAWNVYRVTSHEIVDPSANEVILPVPNEPGVSATEASITLTSCHPEFSAQERYIIHGTLDVTYPADADLPADLWEVS